MASELLPKLPELIGIPSTTHNGDESPEVDMDEIPLITVLFEPPIPVAASPISKPATLPINALCTLTVLFVFIASDSI